MSEDLTQNLPDTFQERVLAELTAIRQENARLSVQVISIDTRLTSLEDKVDARLRETRPIWEGVLERLTEIEKGLSTLNRQFKTMIRGEFDLHTRVEKLEDDQQAV
ncbi:MAG TPA: hypothetical protein VGB76_08390 [Pyrinomonadaceae bacterium]|jgi:hypothetical protein